MTIEFHMPAGEVPEWLVNNLKEKLAELHRQDKAIGRAEVYFRKSCDASGDSFSCAVELAIFGSSIMVEKTAHSYPHAVAELIKELQIRVRHDIDEQRQPPDEVKSTVDV